MMGKNHKGAILVMTGRATLHTSLHKISNRRSEIVSKAIIKKLEQADYPKIVKEIMVDLVFVKGKKENLLVNAMQQR